MKDQYERQYLVDDVVGHIVCWRILRLGDGGKRLRGLDEISASRVGVALRGGAQRGWRWSGASGYPIAHGPRASRLDRFLRLAAATHRLLAAGDGPMLPSEELVRPRRVSVRNQPSDFAGTKRANLRCRHRAIAES